MLHDISLAACSLVIAAAAIYVMRKSANHPSIPTVGSSNWLLSYWDAIKFITDAPSILQEGYKRYRDTPFKVAEFHAWHVVVSGRHFVDEIRQASDDELSSLEAANDALKVEYTLGPGVHYNPYHVGIIRSQLTRNLTVLFRDIRDEVVTAFDEVLDLKDYEWKSIPALDAIQQVVCRTSNRVFVGLPLCRNPDWIDLNIQFTLDVAKGAFVINLFPGFMAPIVARFMTNVPSSIRRGMRLVGPLITDRQTYIDSYGKEWEDEPNDILAWLMDEAEGPERSTQNLTRRLLTVNFAAIHTSSHSFAQALFILAANPQYIQPLREEVESVVQKEGWSKNSLAQMHKIDSFLKESQRTEGIMNLTMGRKAMKDFTFSDGTVIPKGTRVSVASRAIHHDDSIYENAEEFKPFRFASLGEQNREGARHQLATARPEYLSFGLGRHACPGRFFAANELKTMLAHIVTTYDVKLEGPRPKNLQIGGGIFADATAKVMFRKRIM